MAGLLNNWLGKKKKEQLAQTGNKAKTVVKKEPKKETKVAPSGEEAKAEVKVAKKPAVKLPAQSIAYKVLARPLVTEKSAVAESVNKYSFIVAAGASKFQIKKAVEDVYGVKPVAVNIINVEGRRIRFGKTQGKRSDYKKAIITLSPGKSIDIHVGV